MNNGFYLNIEYMPKYSNYDDINSLLAELFLKTYNFNNSNNKFVIKHVNLKPYFFSVVSIHHELNKNNKL